MQQCRDDALPQQEIVTEEGNESHFPGRLIKSLGIPEERGIWGSRGGGKDDRPFFFFNFLYIPQS